MKQVKASDLIRLRLRLGLSVEQSARHCEVTVRTYYRWEAGERRVPRGAMKLLLLSEVARRNHERAKRERFKE